MTITIESTTKIVEFNGLPARIWEGYTESGIKVHCYVTRIAHDMNGCVDHTAQFEKELLEQRQPSTEIQAISLRMLL